MAIGQQIFSDWFYYIKKSSGLLHLGQKYKGFQFLPNLDKTYIWTLLYFLKIWRNMPTALQALRLYLIYLEKSSRMQLSLLWVYQN